MDILHSLLNELKQEFSGSAKRTRNTSLEFSLVISVSHC